MDAIIGPTGICIHLSRCMIISFNLPGRVLARAIFGRHGPLSIHARAHVRHRRSARECCSADQRLLSKITIAEYARESYTPQGIEKGIDFENSAFRADAHSPRYVTRIFKTSNTPRPHYRGSGYSQQAQRSGQGDGRLPIIHAELAIDMPGMQLDRAGRDHQFARNLLVREAPLEQAQDLQLALG